MNRDFYLSTLQTFIVTGSAWTFAIRFMFGIFRLRLGSPWVHSIQLSAVMMIMAIAVKHLFGWDEIIAVMEFLSIFLYLMLVLRIRWFYALVVDTIGCIITLFVMAVTNVFFTSPGENLMSYSKGHMIANILSTALLCAIFATALWACERYRIGFSFVSACSGTNPNRISYKIPLYMVIVTVGAVLLFPPTSMALFPYLLAIVAICLVALLLWSLKHEMTE